MPSPPMVSAGSTDRVSSAAARSPTARRAVTVGASWIPAASLTDCAAPCGSCSWAASSAEITDRLAPVSTTKANGPWPSMRTGAVIRR